MSLAGSPDVIDMLPPFFDLLVRDLANGYEPGNAKELPPAAFVALLPPTCRAVLEARAADYRAKRNLGPAKERVP